MPYSELNSKIKRLVVSDCLQWYFLPQAFTAKLNTERLFVRLEMAGKEEQAEVEDRVDKLLALKRDITDKLGIKAGANLIFDLDLTDGYEESVRENRAKIFPIQEKAFKLFREIAMIMNDPKIFNYCP